jgi:5-enolpyruvylshikimate-3-phosphate synthase
MTMIVFMCSPIMQKSSIERLRITNIANQRIKESNRIDLTIRNMKKIGVYIEEYSN